MDQQRIYSTCAVEEAVSEMVFILYVKCEVTKAMEVPCIKTEDW